jgi:hypothetical protein
VIAPSSLKARLGGWLHLRAGESRQGNKRQPVDVIDLAPRRLRWHPDPPRCRRVHPCPELLRGGAMRWMIATAARSTNNR